jgi:hypothetical protein
MSGCACGIGMKDQFVIHPKKDCKRKLGIKKFEMEVEINVGRDIHYPHLIGPLSPFSPYLYIYLLVCLR